MFIIKLSSMGVYKHTYKLFIFFLFRYVCSFLDLKTLQLKNLSSVNYGIPQFTDITGYLALLRMKRLKNLYIWRSQVTILYYVVSYCSCKALKTFAIKVNIVEHN